MYIKTIAFLALLGLGITSCSKLDEDLNGRLNEQQAQDLFGSGGGGSVSALLGGTYNAMRAPYMEQAWVFALWQHTTDETIGPTRAGDWDDNGVWRALHTHQWDANHSYIANTFRDLGKVNFAATDLLRFDSTSQLAAEARLLRAMASFTMLDGWNQVPYRINTADADEIPSVRTGLDAWNYIVSEVNAIKDRLPDGPATKANKWAARALLMKLYLNKGAIANRQTPTFDAADMAQVVTLANEIIASGKFTLTPNFFDNFAPKNNQLSTENIWTLENVGGISSGPIRARWMPVLHYNQNPGGWNGFTTLADFYDKFAPTDKRLGGDYPGVTNVSGLKVGFLIGQQFDQTGLALKDRKGNPLAFTKEVKLIETGNNLEVTGIRVVKYPPDYVNTENADNDQVLFRLADVLLMKAEAQVRSGAAGAAVSSVNEVRQRAGLTPLGAVTLDNILDERGRELYWENWRRQDLIRFGKFLEPWAEKPTDDPKYLLFPIPSSQIAGNPNLVQNPGYE
jgi:starch-binding outer membrane protein, SusD/RagB family